MFVHGGTEIVAAGLRSGTISENGQNGDVTYLAEAPAAVPVIETFNYVINWGDSSPNSSGPATIDSPGTNVGDTVQGSFDGSHTYADNGTYTVTVTINDNNGGTDTETFLVTVNNVAPTLTLSGASTTNEGSPYTLNLSSSDPGTDTITSWTINWGDAIEMVSGNPASVTHTYADGANNYTISAKATDEDGTFDAGNMVAVTVDNVAPTLAISGGARCQRRLAVHAQSSRRAIRAPIRSLSWTINWGDEIEIVTGNPSSVDAHLCGR